jgi:hypothetical protein
MTFAPQLPLAAYRDDRSRAPHMPELTACDGELVSIGVMLSRCAQLRQVSGGASETMRLRQQCFVMATRALESADRSIPWTDQPAAVEASLLSLAIRSVADIAEDGGALRLANSLLHLASQELGAEAGPVECGRIVAQRGRVARKSGDTEAAGTLYVATLDMAQRENSDELRARALIGLGMLAWNRGNMPATRIHFSSALDAATRGAVSDQAAMAHHGLMLVAAASGAFDEAVVHAWAAFKDVAGDRTREGEALLNVAQAVLDCGKPAVALRAFAAALSRRLPARLELPALGGAAIAAARLGHTDMLHRIIARIDALDSSDFGFERTSAQADAASALALANEPSAEARRAAVMHAASEAGFHEIAYRMENLRTEVGTPKPEVVTTDDVRLVFDQCDALSPGAVHALL